MRKARFENLENLSPVPLPKMESYFNGSVYDIFEWIFYSLEIRMLLAILVFSLAGYYIQLILQDQTMNQMTNDS
jgi:hypothetical protein